MEDLKFTYKQLQDAILALNDLSDLPILRVRNDGKDYDAVLLALAVMEKTLDGFSDQDKIGDTARTIDDIVDKANGKICESFFEKEETWPSFANGKMIMNQVTVGYCRKYGQPCDCKGKEDKCLE